MLCALFVGMQIQRLDINVQKVKFECFADAATPAAVRTKSKPSNAKSTCTTRFVPTLLACRCSHFQQIKVSIKTSELPVRTAEESGLYPPFRLQLHVYLSPLPLHVIGSYYLPTPISQISNSKLTNFLFKYCIMHRSLPPSTIPSHYPR